MAHPPSRKHPNTKETLPSSQPPLRPYPQVRSPSSGAPPHSAGTWAHRPVIVPSTGSQAADYLRRKRNVNSNNYEKTGLHLRISPPLQAKKTATANPQSHCLGVSQGFRHGVTTPGQPGKQL
ncbi:hypothetical protein L873DRAFT_1790682 [Choiromyces venosus 120613-1]|uniref:Uncharacterized protein n=1 Tax=Choiromyces venosus 120613-1 TaxID=1336337 RepID=A0A3N4JMT6_9PEZI|nr:hypothetical protein L873DRAFT_1790682 [Choiromyces venosus 120613-1]